MIKFNKYLLIALFSGLFLTNLNLGLSTGLAVDYYNPKLLPERKSCKFEVNKKFLISSALNKVSVQKCQLVISDTGEVIRVEHTGKYSEQDMRIIEVSYWEQIVAEVANHARYRYDRYGHYYAKPIKVFTEIEIKILSKDEEKLTKPLPTKILYQVRTSTVKNIMKEFETETSFEE